MPATPEQTQQDNSAQIHGAATQALAAVSKLSGLLKQAGAPDDVTHGIDEMANTLNQITSVAVGNAPPANPGSDPNLTPPRDALHAAVQDAHNQAVAAPAPA